MSFDTESAMKPVARKAVPNAFTQSDFAIVPEFDYGVGRTDLVLANVSKPYWKRRVDRLKIDESITDKSTLITFLQLHSRRDPVTEEHFFQLGALKNRYKRQALSWLSDNGFVVKTDSGKIRTAPNLRRHVTTTIAVELKLQKWQKALFQASQGRSFAEYSYVVIDEANVQPALDNIEDFHSENVGLMSLDVDGNLHTHFKPTRRRPHSGLYRWKLNEASLRTVSS